MQAEISGRTAAAIAASLERRLVGPIRSDAPLPTVRQLASTLGVSPATVAAAYKLLKSRGLVSGQGRRGTHPRGQTVGSLRATPWTDARGLRDLATGDPDPDLLPPLGQALRALSVEQKLYGDAPEWPGLVAYASSELVADGIPVLDLAVLSGGFDALERVLREHLRPGDRVALEDPCVPAVVDLASMGGYSVVPFAVDDAGPIPDSVEAALRRGCQAIVVSPRAHNPTGAALTPSRADDLRRVLRRFPDVVLVEHDDAGAVAGVEVQTLCEPARARWAFVRSLSKSLGPDLRVAILTGDEVTVGRVRGRHALGARWVSHILQQLACIVWSDPANGRRVARAGEIYAARRTALLAALGSHRIAAHGRSGYNVWVPVRHEGTVVRALAERGWAVAPGERFRIQSGPAVRITASTIGPEEAERLAVDVARAVTPVSGGLA
jgi:DNA-binding transcriptional MocR family regulator